VPLVQNAPNKTKLKSLARKKRKKKKKKKNHVKNKDKKPRLQAKAKREESWCQEHWEKNPKTYKRKTLKHIGKKPLPKGAHKAY